MTSVLIFSILVFFLMHTIHVILKVQWFKFIQTKYIS